jgi:putative RecB family exonuclease
MNTYEPLPGVICPACRWNVVIPGKQTFQWSHAAKAWLCPNCQTPYQDACEMTNQAGHYRTEKNQTPLPREDTNMKRTTKKQTAPAQEPILKLSHSQLETWEQCRLKWKFQKIDMLPSAPSEALIFGTAIHAMLEMDGYLIANENSRMQDFHMLAAFDKVLQAELAKSDPYNLINKQRMIAMRARAQDIIRKYIAIVQPTYRPIEVEKDFSFILDGLVEFRGRIDAVTATSILDWKTASKPWETESQHQKDQATAYLIARPDMARVSFAVFSGVGDDCRFQSLATTRTERQKEDYSHKVLMAAGAIHAAEADDDFPANPGPLCGWCGMLAHCTAGQVWLKLKGRVPQVPVLPASKLIETKAEA